MAAPLLLTGGRVLVGGDGHHRRPVAADVVVDGGRIAALGPGDVAPSGAVVRRLDGLTVLPGVIDAHVHVQFATAEAILAGGVTTVRDLGGPPTAALALRGTTPLRVLAAGRILTAPGGYPGESWGADGTAREVAGAADAAAAVTEQVAAGADVVKVALEDSGGRPLLDPDALAAVVAAAHAAGRRVTAHVGSAPALSLAAAAGVDELCHLPLHDVTAEELAPLAEAGVVVVPTLAIRSGGPAAMARALAALRGFRAAGGRVVYGSDLGNEGTAPGISAEELRLLAAAGMSPDEVLDAATSGAADHLGLEGAGRLAVGAAADLVAVDGDPLADPWACAQVRLVVAGGALVRDDLG